MRKSERSLSSSVQLIFTNKLFSLIPICFFIIGNAKEKEKPFVLYISLDLMNQIKIIEMIQRKSCGKNDYLVIK